LAVDRAVLELDHGVLALAAETFEVVALAGPQRALDELILAPRIVERLLDLPARMARDLRPRVRAAMQSERHGPTRRRRGGACMRRTRTHASPIATLRSASRPAGRARPLGSPADEHDPALER